MSRTSAKNETAASAATRRGDGAGRLRAGLTQTVAAAVGLLAEGDLAHAGVASDARDLLLDEIEPDAGQPRRHFDEAGLRALADDIGRRGVLQPVLVRPPLAPGGPYRLVAGERRWRAARLAGKVRIPARVRDIGDEDVQAAQLAENVLRAGLTDIEKGAALRRLYELRKSQDHKATWEDIAAEVGLGRARISDLFNLAALPEPVAALIASGRLSGSHGIALQRAQDALPSGEVLALAERASRPETRKGGGYGLSVASLRRLIHSRAPDVAGASPPTEEREASAGGAGRRVGRPAALDAVTEGGGDGKGSGLSRGENEVDKGVAVPEFLRLTLAALAAGTLPKHQCDLLAGALADAPGWEQTYLRGQEEGKPEVSV